jgi:hypothetical protein
MERESKMDIVQQLEGPHEWGYRGLAGEGFIADDAPFNAVLDIVKLREAVEDAIDTLEAMSLHVDNPLYERLKRALGEG